MQESIIVPFIVFTSTVLVVWIFNFFAARKRAEAFATLRLAIEKGQEVTPEAMESLSRLSHPLADLRRGVVLVALAAGFMALAGIVSTEEEQAVRPLLGVSVFPLFLGLAFLGLHVFTNKKTAA